MFLRIITRQTRHKWGIALLIFLAMTALVTLYVYSKNTSAFANRSMQIVMKNMGHNLLILPEDTDPQAIYLCSDQQPTFSGDIARQMAQSLGLSSKYYVAVLQAKTQIGDQEVLLTGIEPIARRDESAEKRNMILPLEDDELRLGFEVARKLDKNVGDSLQIAGETFRVVEILPPKANVDDCRAYISLGCCQEILGSEGQIHYILAFLCLHAGSLDRALKIQEQDLAGAFPGFRQISRMDIVQGRHLARITTQKSLHYLLGIVAVVTVMIIAVTGLQEVSDRRHETGIMIAMGVPHAYVVALYLAKTLALALAAAVLGFLIGSALAVQFTTPFLIVNTQPISILWEQLPAIIGLTSAVAIVAEIVPVVRLLSLDPNIILTEQ